METMIECPLGHGPLTDGQCTRKSIFYVCFYTRDPHGDHFLIVHTKVDPNTGRYETELIHPLGCKPVDDDFYGTSTYPCGAYYALAESWLDGMEELEQPGRYRIEVWSDKSWTDYGWEHDGGVLLIDTESSARLQSDSSTISDETGDSPEVTKIAKLLQDAMEEGSIREWDRCPGVPCFDVWFLDGSYGQIIVRDDDHEYRVTRLRDE